MAFASPRISTPRSCSSVLGCYFGLLSGYSLGARDSHLKFWQAAETSRYMQGASFACPPYCGSYVTCCRRLPYRRSAPGCNNSQRDHKQGPDQRFCTFVPTARGSYGHANSRIVEKSLMDHVPSGTKASVSSYHKLACHLSFPGTPPPPAAVLRTCPTTSILSVQCTENCDSQNLANPRHEAQTPKSRNISPSLPRIPSYEEPQTKRGKLRGGRLVRGQERVHEHS